jgi:hypothetical protein
LATRCARRARGARGRGSGAGEDGKRGGPAGGKLAGGLVVGAVDFIEHEEGEAARAHLEKRLDQGGVERRRAGAEPVAQGAPGFEHKAGGAQAGHVLPDRHALTPSLAARAEPDTQPGSRARSSLRMRYSAFGMEDGRKGARRWRGGGGGCDEEKGRGRTIEIKNLSRTLAQMSFAEMRQSLERDAAPPAGVERRVAGVVARCPGRLGCRACVCAGGRSRDGSWVHAYLHRKEGDPGNAGYWYARAGRPMPARSVTLGAEWAAMARELVARG